jgi:hypothetical protein
MTEAREVPLGVDLLVIARQTLLDAVIPALSGDARFKALMVANAMAIALREQSAPAFDAGDLATLARDIRAGAYDPGTRDHDAVATRLTELAQARCRISAPKALG